MSATEMFWSAPPIARTLTAATLAISLLVYTNLLPGFWLFWSLSHVFSFPPQIWRIVTPFLITDPGLSILFDTYFMYTYSSQLEVGSPRFTQPGSFFTYITFICSVVVAVNNGIFGGSFGWRLTHGLILAFVYTACQDNRGGQVNFMVVNIPAQWAPLGMIAVSFLMAGPERASLELIGLIAAHLYDFLTRIYPEFGGGRNPIHTPAFVRKWFAPDVAGVSNRAYGTVFTPAERQTAGSSSGASTGPLPESWRSRGSGHRLGGE